ncbi:MAG TPA: VOC family protein [Candidatus Limnocylindrales bacterium]|nr:VOC family protein [Candidatus Limnocylindrales bacterium]
MADRIIHAEIVGKDAGKLQKFFAELFDWKLDTNNPGGYGMTAGSDTGVVAGIGSTPDGSAGHVTFYVSVPDIDKSLAKATELGGRVIMPKFSPGPGATLALVADPEGHVVGLTEA